MHEWSGFVGQGWLQLGELMLAFADPVVRSPINTRKKAFAISPDAIARAVAFAIEQPMDVEIGSIVVRPTE